jgi:Ca2+-binding EF-hand superfamily protein
MECDMQFDPLKAFGEIDDWNYGYVDKRNLKMFLKSNGYVPSDQEVIQIIRRIDTDGDSRISKSQFISFLAP